MLSCEGPYLFNLNDDPNKKLLICVQQKVIYGDKKYFWKILTLIQMKPTTLMIVVVSVKRSLTARATDWPAQLIEKAGNEYNEFELGWYNLKYDGNFQVKHVWTFSH